jgi:hypothetical protein
VRLRAGLAAGDLTGEVAAAWQGKELLRAVYATGDLADARTALESFYRWADGSTEALNLLIKEGQARRARLPNFVDYRLRLLLHCGVSWQTHRTARLRGRSPCLVA